MRDAQVYLLPVGLAVRRPVRAYRGRQPRPHGYSLQAGLPTPGPLTTAITPAAASARSTQINATNIDNLTLAWFYRISSVGPQRGVGNPDDQVDAPDGQRRPLLHHSRPRLGARRPHRRRDLALRLAGQRRPSGGQSRPRHVWRLALLHDARLLVRLAQRQGRQGALAQEDRRREDAVLLHHVAAGGEESRPRGRGRRRHGRPRLPGIARPRDRRAALALEHHPAQGRTRRRRRGPIRRPWSTAAA